MIATPDVTVCTNEQHAELLRHARLGRLFELMEWVDQGKPTLCPDFERPRCRNSLIHEALERGNHSMVRVLWERAWQREWEIESLISTAIRERDAACCEIAKYLLKQGLPLGRSSACSIFETHDDELILMAMEQGLNVRGPDGFADALSTTGHSKHLLRLFRELRGRFPDLDKEGLVALRETVEKGKLRAAALLTWAGVDPLFAFPNDPYDEEEYNNENGYLTSALDELRIDEKTREMLKALKVEMTVDVWFRFFGEAGWLRPESLPEVYHWIRNADQVLLAHPENAAKMATKILCHFSSWGDEWRIKTRQAEQLKACEYLASLGVPFLVMDHESDLRSIRRSCGNVKNTEALVRLFWMIHERGDGEQRGRLKELVQTPKMQSLVRQYDPFLLRDLGLGPKHLAKVTVTKKDRPWHIDTYKVIFPFEKPPKVKPEPPAPVRPLYVPPPPQPEPRRGYWNKWSHFHR
ncbi:MAG: hypothetical protein WCP45_10425 [Verrucomicrobiota bacterium]